MSFSTPSQSLGYLRCHLFQPRGQVPTQVVEREPCAAVAATCGLDRVPDLNRAGTHVLALGRRHRHSTDDRHPDNQEVLRSGRSSQSVALSSGFPPSLRPCASTARAGRETERGTYAFVWLGLSRRCRRCFLALY